MKKQAVLLAFITLFVLSACSNNQYQDAMDKGIASLGVKNYHQASIYFEIALKEKEGDTDASSYLKQSNQMGKAIQAYELKEYDSALLLLSEIISAKNGLQTLQKEAQILKDRIAVEKELISSVEEEVELVKDLIEKENYQLAKEELHVLQSKVEANEALVAYQAEVMNLLEKVNLALENNEKSAKDETETGKVNEDKDTKGEEDSHIQEEKITYLTYTNDRFGFSFEYPSGLSMDPPPTNGDGVRFYNDELEITAYGGHTNIVNENETIEDYYQSDLDSISNEIAYQRVTANWYVLSYKENEMIVYKKFFFGDDIFNTIITTYPAVQQDKYGPVTTHISDTFRSTSN